MLEFLIYSISFTDKISLILKMGSILLILPIFIGVIGYTGYSLDNGFDNKISKKIRSVLNKVIISFLITLFFYCIIPNSKTLVAMYIIPKLASSDQLAKIPSKSLDFLNLKLDQWIDDLKPKEVKDEIQK